MLKELIQSLGSWLWHHRLLNVTTIYLPKWNSFNPERYIYGSAAIVVVTFGGVWCHNHDSSFGGQTILTGGFSPIQEKLFAKCFQAMTSSFCEGRMCCDITQILNRNCKILILEFFLWIPYIMDIVSNVIQSPRWILDILQQGLVNWYYLWDELSYREVSKPRDSCLTLSNVPEIRQATRQQRCRDVC